MTSLQNFPKWNPYACEADKKRYLNRVFQWRENFEKEMRESKQRYEAEIEKTDSDMWKEIYAQMAFEIGRFLEGRDRRIDGSF